MKRATFTTCRSLSLAFALVLLLFSGLDPAPARAGEPTNFASPEKAVAALIGAIKMKDRTTVLAILGEQTKDWISSGDAVQDREAQEEFIAAYKQKNEIEKVGDDKAVLAVGDDSFPFPFPMIKNAKGWAFDPVEGEEELLSRRIGRNELTTIQVIQAVGDAQREYASIDRDGDGRLEYATQLRSAEGKQDGLYWPTAAGGPLSPLGPLVAAAIKGGYAGKVADANSGTSNAFHGYHYKLLTRQGADAPGGAYDYIVNGKMIGGFAVLAYPARYDNSGIMSFMVGHDGQVFEADLGPETAKEVEAMDSFNPGEGWK